MDRTCEYYDSCGLEFCMYDVECPEYQKKIKPILFNTQMVRAIQKDIKTKTRRIIKPKYSNTHFMFRTDKYGTEFVEMQNDVEGETFGKNPDGGTWHKLLGYIRPAPLYQKGDILYVRETWGDYDGLTPYFLYRADYPNGAATYMLDNGNVRHLPKWRPSIHMPKEAARIFLRVTDVRAEHLWDITEEDAIKEGFRAGDQPGEGNSARSQTARQSFMWIWQRLYDKGPHPWASNPWVWVYEFERCEKPGGRYD